MFGQQATVESPPPTITRRAWVIVNGKIAASPEVRETIGWLSERGHQIKVRVTWEGGDAEGFAQEGADAGAEVVVAFGGDGTLHEVISGVITSGRACAVGLVPGGTANDFAVASGVPLGDLRAAFLLALEGTPTQIDVGMLNDHPFINVATGGIGTTITVDTPHTIKERLGSFAYVLTGLQQMANLEAIPATIRGPHMEWEGKFFALAIGNGRQAGGGFQLCPHAAINDGMLDVTIIPEMPQTQLFSLIGAVRQGTISEDDRVIYYQVPWATIETSSELQINLDGEPLHGETMHFRCLPQQLPFMLPPSSPLLREHGTE